MKTMSEEVKAKFTQATSEDQVTELVESFVKCTSFLLENA